MSRLTDSLLRFEAAIDKIENAAGNVADGARIQEAIDVARQEAERQLTEVAAERDRLQASLAEAEQAETDMRRRHEALEKLAGDLGVEMDHAIEEVKAVLEQ